LPFIDENDGGPGDVAEKAHSRRKAALILRLIRFKGMAGQFGALTAALCDDTTALAAE
jgi:hypothetical protein